MNRRIMQLLATAATFAMANNIAVTHHPADLLDSKIQALKDIRQNAKLFGEQEDQLDSLLAQADKIAKTNRQCGAIAIKVPLDENCLVFHEKTFPEFDRKLLELEGEIRMNEVREARQQDDNRAIARACANALFPEPRIDDIVTMDGDLLLKPPEFGQVVFQYNLTLGISQGKKEALQNHFTKWSRECSMAIAPEGNFTQPFIEALNEHARPGQATYKASQDKVTFHSGARAKFGYYINDRFLFGSFLEEGTPLFSFNSMGKAAFPDITASRWQTYTAFDLEDIKARGFRSKLNWGDRIAPKRNIRWFKRRRSEKTVTIGSQEWFSLDYLSMDWDSAQNMCPKGWHIPSVADWEILIDFVEKNSYGEPAALSLKTNKGWRKNGSNQHGFSAIYYNAYENTHEGQECAVYWTSDKNDYDEAYTISLCDKPFFSKKEMEKNIHLFRCVKDDEFKTREKTLKR